MSIEPKPKRVLSEETKAKMSSTHVGMRHTDEAKAKMSASHMGMRLSEETKAKLSKAHMGIKPTEESKEKAHRTRLLNKGMSDAQATEIIESLKRVRKINANLSAKMDGRPLNTTSVEETPQVNPKKKVELEFANTMRVKVKGLPAFESIEEMEAFKAENHGNILPKGYGSW